MTAQETGFAQNYGLDHLASCLNELGAQQYDLSETRQPLRALYRAWSKAEQAQQYQ